MLRSVFFLFSFWTSVVIHAQSVDTLLISYDTLKGKSIQIYSIPGANLIYSKPKPIQFIVQLPKVFVQAAKETFRKESIPVLATIVVSTGLLIAADQRISCGVQDFYKSVDISTYRNYKTIIGFNLGHQCVNAYEAPQNFNTLIYSIGEGSTSVFLAGGLSLYGLIENDYRARHTANEIMQSIIGLGITTQVLKRMAGRESPFVATQPSGKWRPFTNFSTYQKHVPMHDAFPSGHLATVMATVTVLASNYPEKSWIGPVGYSITGLVGLAMIGNGVHWSGDYPLALGLGYIFGKATVKLNRILQQKELKHKD